MGNLVLRAGGLLLKRGLLLQRGVLLAQGVLLAGVVLGGGARVWGQSPAPTVLLETDAGDKAGIRLELHAGDYEMRRSPDRELRVMEVREAGSTARATKTHIATRHGRVEVEVDPPTANHDKNVHVVVEVPRCAELEVSLTAGEMVVKEVPCEETAVTMHAGELVAGLGEAAAYRQVEATVTIGEVTANGFDPKGDADHGGFFPKYAWEGPGVRRFRAHVGTGEIRLGKVS